MTIADASVPGYQTRTTSNAKQKLILQTSTGKSKGENLQKYIKALASARGSEKKEKNPKKNPKKNQKNRASAYICFCRLRAKSRI